MNRILYIEKNEINKQREVPFAQPLLFCVLYCNNLLFNFFFFVFLVFYEQYKKRGLSLDLISHIRSLQPLHDCLTAIFITKVTSNILRLPFYVYHVTMHTILWNSTMHILFFLFYIYIIFQFSLIYYSGLQLSIGYF